MGEELLEEFVRAQGMWIAYAVLFIGAVILTYSVEKLISYLTRAAFQLGVSVLALATIFTGFEFDDTAVALVFGMSGLEQVALGTALGTALAITGITLAVAAVVRPFPSDIPPDYVLLFGLSPLLLVPFVLLGSLMIVHGVLLVGVFIVLLAYIVLREFQRDLPVFRNSEIAERIEADGGASLEELSAPEVDIGQIIEPIPEDRVIMGRAYPGVVWLGFAVFALGGVVLGASLLETSSELLIKRWEIEQTVFGATILTLVLTFENLLLMLEPVRRGIPEIGIGHVIGSVIFSVTANIGVILFVADFRIPRSVLVFHLPAVVVLTTVAAAVIYSGQIRRWHGYTLAALYIAYWLIAFLVFGTPPTPDPI